MNGRGCGGRIFTIDLSAWVGELPERFGVRVHGGVLMDNHSRFCHPNVTRMQESGCILAVRSFRYGKADWCSWLRANRDESRGEAAPEQPGRIGQRLAHPGVLTPEEAFDPVAVFAALRQRGLIIHRQSEETPAGGAAG